MDGALPVGASKPEPPIALFGEVLLNEALSVEGEAVPRGAVGTVVEILPDGVGCIVEFFEPRHCIVTVERPRLRAVSG